MTPVHPVLPTGTTIPYKRQSKNVQKWEFKNVQFYSLNISFKR